jgi:flagellar hook-associated protein 1 FlgK
MSIASILNIARSAMFAQQASIQISSNNIANVNTKGYCRLDPDLREAPLIPTDYGLLGNGVEIAGFIRYFDKFLEASIAQRNTDLQEQKTAVTYFERIESILNEDSSKLATNVTEFFNSWQELSADPANLARRSSLVAKGENLARTIRNIYSELNGLQRELDQQVQGEVDEINRLTASIADLNEKIISLGSASQGEASDYLNQRAELLKELSGKMKVVSFEDQAGGLTVLTENGRSLVDRTSSWKLRTQQDPATGFRNVAWEDGAGNLTDITGAIKSGRLRALLDMRDQHLGNGFIADINNLAQTIITEVNSRHMEGYGLKDSAGVASTGIPFFAQTTSDFARSIDLSVEVRTDVRYIAAASSADDYSGNDNALRIASLIDTDLMIGGQSTRFSTYISTVMSNIGDLTKNAQDLSDHQESAMTIMEQQRESRSGVSIDEELTKLMKYQYAYQAAARLISVADEMFQDILGVVK